LILAEVGIFVCNLMTVYGVWPHLLQMYSS